MGGGSFELRVGSHAPERLQAQSGGARTPVGYDRVKAVDYARFFCGRVCSDGFIMSKTRQHPRKAGAPLGDVKEVDEENDCTHFVSCCLGTPPPFKDDASGTKIEGGGLVLDRQGFLDGGKAGVYGMLEPGALAQYLRLTRRVAFATMQAGELGFSNDTPQVFDNTTSVVGGLRSRVQGRFSDDLGKGDLVVFFRDGKAHHSAVLVNDAWGVACHSGSRCGADGITAVNHPHFIYARFKQFKEDVL